MMVPVVPMELTKWVTPPWVCHGVAAFLALVGGHVQFHAVAAHGSGHGQGNAGVTTGGFDQGIAGLDLAASLGLHDHIQGRAIFHRACRIVAFQLHQNGIGGVARHPLQANQGRIAHGLFDGFMVHGAHCT